MAEYMSAEVLKQYVPVDEREIDRLLNKEMNKSQIKFVVLDDDPTGIQTVHDVSVYTDWSKASMRKGFLEENRLFYILTNSRSMTPEQTRQVHEEIARTAQEISQEMNQKYVLISRSDSTLRGHYPLETNVLKEAVEKHGNHFVDGEILCFFFKEGGRYTIDNIHYVKDSGMLIPAGETEFAKDKTFGYRSSDLREYVEEKNKGAFKAGDTICISLEMLRNCSYAEIEQRLMAAENFHKVIVNAVDYCDLKVFCTALYRAMEKGKTFLFRSAASLVKVIGGVSDRDLLTRKEMITADTNHGGIVVVGSHTNKTTAQLKELLTLTEVTGIEFDSDLVLKGEQAFDAEIRRVVSLSEQIIASGKTAVCFTKRRLLTVDNDSKMEALLRSVKISQGVQALVGKLNIVPAFVVAKGGITSSDIGTKALSVKKANVMGQIKPGIPVWQTDEQSKFPRIPYIIFPGNVGESSTLKEAVEELIRR
ncbi:four-carbon acid sugar kinase family protein [Anaerostipes sp.]|uniref:four-carbon acid sugar kinase family protein n=1 Tax=Anaerostipes sp. TaxID=1872530 RepID=UPI0025C6A948|nr:four-carbon acid sugar kinase family protein [Anaerostipes sp.]MBS7006821.1 hydroxyacid dehydrogenase [Anaerostipes sp.]